MLSIFSKPDKQKDKHSSKQPPSSYSKWLPFTQKDNNNHVFTAHTFEEVKLNKRNLRSGSFETLQQSEKSDIMSDIVIIDYKDIEPYTKQEWKALIEDLDIIEVDQQRLFVSLQQGIPKELRKDIWLYLANVEHLKRTNKQKGVTYQSLLAQNCPHLATIRKDIPRTFPKHEFFVEDKKERLQHLENVLRAYAVFDPDVGYTQGMNFLVGTLIYYMHLERTETDYCVIDPEFESDIFWILVHMLQEKNWRSVYIENTPRLVELLRRLEVRIEEELPKLSKLFMENGVIPACFSQCFLTLLFYNSPLQFAKRVLDMFLLVGEEIIFDLIINMLTFCQDEILAKTEIEELYSFLRNDLVHFTFQHYQKEFSKLVAEQNVIRIIEYE